ncbi:hypothetical protein P4B35_10030 [Pontiellaceae bacterium B12227]|nr:hypothetical protein [Pontiellaceae bacterium B12227]
MSAVNKCLVSKDSGRLQIPYQDYVALVEKAKEGERMRLVKKSVIASLQNFLGGECQVHEVSEKIDNARTDLKPEAPVSKKVSVEFGSETSAPEKEEAPAPVKPAAKAPAVNGRGSSDGIQVPPIKKDVSVHFNSIDESGRLFNVFKQYYACLNDSCGGTVRVTMKDGFCSLWNYDEWEEFAFVDIFEGQLRIALDPRYTEALQSLNLCEVPRLLSSRRNLVCVQVDDLNNTMLDVLVKAFEEVGLTAG